MVGGSERKVLGTRTLFEDVTIPRARTQIMKTPRFPAFGTASPVLSTDETTFLDCGFLSYEADSKRWSDTVQGSELLARAKDAVRSAHVDITLLDSMPVTASEWPGLALWQRTLESCQATVILADRGMVGSSIAALRIAYECLIFACAVWRDPTVVDRLEATNDYSMLKAGERGRPQFAAEFSADIVEHLNRLKAQPQRTGINVEQAAKIAGLEPTYNSLYLILSNLGAHATSRSLEEYALQSSSTEILGNFGPRFDESARFVITAVECMRFGQGRFREHFSSASYGPAIPKISLEFPYHPPS